MLKGPRVCFLKWNGYRDALTLKKVGFPCSGLNSGWSFISQDEGICESPLETLEEALGHRLIWTWGLTSLDTSRGTQSSMLQKVTMPDSS